MSAILRRRWLPIVLFALLGVVMLLSPTTAQGPEGRRYALMIGASQYASKSLPPVPYAGDDARDIARMLNGAGFQQVMLMTEAEAKRDPRARPTLANIRAALKAFTAGKTNRDVLVVGFFGHGVTMKVGPRNVSYLCPVDAQLRDVRTLLSVEELYRDLEGSRAGATLVMLDPTQEVAGKDAVPLDTNALPPLPRNFSALFGATGRQVALSSETLGTGHGAFAFALMEGLSGKANRRKGREDITWNDLTEYALKETPEIAKAISPRARQTPLLVANLAGASPVLVAGRGEAGVGKGPKSITNSIGMKLVRIPAGTFTMGSPATEKGRKPDEDQRTVRITRSFYMGTFEVTQAEFFRVLNKAPSFYSVHGKGAEVVRDFDTRPFPVEQVTYAEAVAFCDSLSALPEEKKAGHVYRLPTEAEWEYACRAGTTTVFAVGNRLGKADANFDSRHSYNAPNAAGLGRPCSVGQYAPNAWGLYDMHGNVYEWTSDWYATKHGAGPFVDPTGPARGRERVIRGGSFAWEGWQCRSANRRSFEPAGRGNNVGFRVVLERRRD